MENFFYEDPAGEGIKVYHIDIGPFAMDHDEFKTDSKARRETIEVNLDKENRVAIADHRTCAASKIVGQGVGTAKRAGLDTVRIDADPRGVIKGLQAAAKDIIAKDLRGKAVVSISVGLEIVDPKEDAVIIGYIREVLQVLQQWDIPVVCPSAWAIGQEDRGTYSIQVCLFFDQNAPKVVSQAPADAEGKCPFKYYDKASPEPAS
ncbi:subtilisin-like protease [Colletotrichum asianum]